MSDRPTHSPAQRPHLRPRPRPRRRTASGAGSPPLVSSTMISFMLIVITSVVSASQIQLTPDFHFDGTTSDIAQQLYLRSLAGDTAEPLVATHDDLPDRIRSRLEERDLLLELIPPLLQRALVWDSGYALGPKGEFIRVYTTDGVPMAEIMVSLAEFDESQCSASVCTQGDRTAFRSKNCTGAMMMSVAHCATEEVLPVFTHTSMWATGGSDTMVPMINALRHSWNDPLDRKDYVVFAIHTVPNEQEPAWDICPDAAPSNQGGGNGGLIIPCDVYSPSRAVDKNWKDPPRSALVDAWLDATKTEQQSLTVGAMGSGPYAYEWTYCVGVPVVAVGVIVGLVIRRRRRRQPQGQAPQVETWGSFEPEKGGSGCLNSLLSGGAGSSGLSGPAVSVFIPIQSPRPGRARQTATATTATAISAAHVLDHAGSVPVSPDSGHKATQRMTQLLQHDPNLRGTRVPMDALTFRQRLSRGGFGEVWLGEFRGHSVAIKKLLDTRRGTLDDLDDFIDEIQLTASLRHAHVVHFLGVCWGATLDGIGMITEYMADGDLQGYLALHREAPATLTWPQQKRALALGVARALEYLHARTPVLIHRDVKSRNILVNASSSSSRADRPTAKLGDFGVSRCVHRSGMTVGVGTPYWTAPEVLDGSLYTEKSDIYSFGVVLSELDTCQRPYQDMLSTTTPRSSPVASSPCSVVFVSGSDSESSEEDEGDDSKSTANRPEAGLDRAMSHGSKQRLKRRAASATQTESEAAADQELQQHLRHRMRPFRVLSMIISGALQPRFSAQCPAGIRALASACLSPEPADRPSARTVVKTLESMNQWTS